MKNDCELIAKKNNIEFKWNDKFPINSLSLMRGYLVIDAKLKKKYFDNCFNAYWKDNIDISNEVSLFKILEKCEVDINFFNESINQQKIKDELKELTSKAFEMDIFGAPTFIVNKKLFWGQDRLDYALDEYNS
jgi:2-hydroxychromene-2-carboxylate isomerase